MYRSVKMATNAVKVSLDGFYTQVGNTPLVTWDGIGPSRLELEDSDVYGALVRASIGF